MLLVTPFSMCWRACSTLLRPQLPSAVVISHA